LKNNNYPKDLFRLLCHNCNMARGCYGYCPHEKLVNTLIESASGKEDQLLSHGETK
jgi:radical SAM protein with 4Fe4S-binding SPASM domain